MPKVTLLVHTLINGDILEPGEHDVDQDTAAMLRKSGALERKPWEATDMEDMRRRGGGFPTPPVRPADMPDVTPGEEDGTTVPGGPVETTPPTQLTGNPDAPVVAPDADTTVVADPTAANGPRTSTTKPTPTVPEK